MSEIEEYFLVPFRDYVDTGLIVMMSRDRDILDAYIDLLPKDVKLGPEYFAGYINRLISTKVLETMEDQISEFIEVLKELDRWED